MRPPPRFTRGGGGNSGAENTANPTTTRVLPFKVHRRRCDRCGYLFKPIAPHHTICRQCWRGMLFYAEIRRFLRPADDSA